MIAAIAIIGALIPNSQNDIKYGKLLSAADNREGTGTVTVRVKISSNLTNKMTVEQNYYNVVDLIVNKGFDNCKFKIFFGYGQD